MSAPEGRKFTKTHEWVAIDGDVATFGLTDHAQGELGDITYLELPEVGDSVSAGEPFGVVESVKAASDVYSPIDGEVIEINGAAVDGPEVINASPYDDAWLVKVRIADPAQLEALMDTAAYDEYEANQ
ncbi:MAG: glycine cleavage system protein GcvH [Thermomicrobiales bacterium]|nr:glycine cleavage system protein GcvH [Thermomicrobiales bacterium]MCO5228583.1 glycine cleavage system protein GcvH [Thermomicrobiales bacterium]